MTAIVRWCQGWWATLTLPREVKQQLRRTDYDSDEFVAVERPDSGSDRAGGAA